MTIKRVLVTGATGMLGAAVVARLKNQYQVFATGNSEIGKKYFARYKAFDLKNTSYGPLISWAQPDVIIHCAALTDVDYCQKHPKEVFRVNGESVEKLLESGGRIIYISSDAVFSASTHLAKETEATNPINVYGESKALGEKYLLADSGSHTVIRTTIIGKHTVSPGKSLAEWIVTSVREKRDITLFSDVFFTPVSVWYLACEIAWCLKKDLPKIIHIASKDKISKYDFGKRLCQKMKLDVSFIRAGKLGSSNLTAARKHDQSLDATLYSQIRGKRPPAARDAIKDFSKH